MQHFENTNARDALKRRSPIASWAKAKDRLAPEVWPTISPHFKMQAGAKVFTIGSCFARNIEEHLSLLGFDLPTLGFAVPTCEWSGLRTNGILNKYTPATVYQEIEWAAAIFKRGDGFQPDDATPMRFDLADTQVIDLQLGGFIPVTKNRFIARRAQIYELYAHAFDSDLIALTYGLTESWQDRATGLHIHQPPASQHLLRAATGFDFINIDCEGALAYMRRTVDVLRELNPTVSILVTTSPVPLNNTFTEQDVITANMLSKSTLRSAIGKLESLVENLDYFPSYESAVLSPVEVVYETDMRHIQDGFVGKIVERLIEYYFETPDEIGVRIQKAAVALGIKNDEKHAVALLDLVKIRPNITTLSDDQLNVYLRTSWHLRNKKLVNSIATEILRRDIRIHRHLRAISHIFPRCGLGAQLKNYARGVLKIDPTCTLALKCLGGV